VPPVVAHIVGISELAYLAIDQRAKLYVLGRGNVVVRPFRVRHAVAAFARLKVPEMIILPPHGGLDHVVEHLEASSDRHLDYAPDRGLDVVEADAQSSDGLLRHAAVLDVGAIVAKRLSFLCAPAERNSRRVASE